jgi:hypothetical protein
MSLTPDNPPGDPTPPGISDHEAPESYASTEIASAPPAPPRRWPGRVLSICFAIFALEVGLFLVIFPWQDNWTLNYFQGLFPAMENIWDEPYFRGAVTGLGLINVYVALLQVVRLLRRG